MRNISLINTNRCMLQKKQTSINLILSGGKNRLGLYTDFSNIFSFRRWVLHRCKSCTGYYSKSDSRPAKRFLPEKNPTNSYHFKCIWLKDDSLERFIDFISHRTGSDKKSFFVPLLQICFANNHNWHVSIRWVLLFICYDICSDFLHIYLIWIQQIKQEKLNSNKMYTFAFFKQITEYPKHLSTTKHCKDIPTHIHLLTRAHIK